MNKKPQKKKTGLITEIAQSIAGIILVLIPLGLLLGFFYAPQYMRALLPYHDTQDEIKLYPNPVQRHLHLKELMLQLTNEERQKEGAPPVRLGTNPAAQLHAEGALRGCYSAHWDQWGLKPNHRYTLTGGTGDDAENVSGSDYCIKITDNYESLRAMEQEIAETVTGWMNSPGHRRTLLNPAHTTLNIGIAHDRYNTVMVQQFASDYVTYITKPNIDGTGILRLEATAKKGNFQHLQFSKPPGLL